ncbi:Extracellular matrix-binding ebh, putative [Babesia ovata]|uniref:Extracellular matrix-binding ebh, putative n=1 Tax=Babesia ovata TaxID=189622 RepID=A0A2H6KDW5_9APIC|nr:Extracellular matrix-binding ebh, putative [Babesia ovata]GBE61177.1 Extracellular matrix-binding ebh, putative [Babesia ovata]
MDSDLKRDLKSVKMEIKEGIKEVITFLQVTKLDGLVKDDLGELRGKIEGLGKDVESNGLVKAQLEKLAEEKKNLETVTGKTTGTIDKEMGQLESKFNTYIKTPLNLQVTEVDTAIGTLGGKFELRGGSEKKLEEIFKQIKEKVGEIKGEAGMFAPNGQWNPPGSGLDGIKSKVGNYFNAFSGEWPFKNIVKGWIEKTILPHNGLVSDRINDKIFGGSRENSIQKMAGEIKENLGVEATEAGQTVEQAKSGGAEDIAKRIQAVKNGCENFANALDNKLKEGKSGLVTQIKSGVLTYIKHDAKCICDCTHCKSNQECSKNSLTAVILGSLSAVSRQVGNELNSLFLNIPDKPPNAEPSDGSIAKILDTITPIVDGLKRNLDDATSPNPPGGSTDSPAQAVDSKLEAVRNMVEKDKLITTFKSEVTKELTEAVKGLPNAVEEFDKQAQDQIKAAAKTAITAAAEQISNGSTIELGGAEKLMDNFHQAHNRIKADLESQVKKEVDTHIGADDSTGGQGATITELAGTSFDQYKGHVNQESVEKFDKDKPEDLQGKLPDAIKQIKTLGLEALEGVIGVSATKPINDDTFEVPFTEIRDGLIEIAGLVDIKQSTSPTTLDDKGVKDYLGKLSHMIKYRPWVDGGDGLENIINVIKGLQKSPFTAHPKAIDTAVSLIKEELKKLREKLKKEKMTEKDDVINALNDLKSFGLGDSDWTLGNTKWKTTHNLKSIEIDLRNQNAILPQQTDIIGKAIKEIRGQLASIGYRLNDYGSYDDVVDQLQRRCQRGNQAGTHSADEHAGQRCHREADQFDDQRDE